MYPQLQISCLKLPLNSLPHIIRMAHNAKQSADRQVPVNQCFGLIPFKFGRVFRC